MEGASLQLLLLMLESQIRIDPQLASLSLGIMRTALNAMGEGGLKKAPRGKDPPLGSIPEEQLDRVESFLTSILARGALGSTGGKEAADCLVTLAKGRQALGHSCVAVKTLRELGTPWGREMAVGLVSNFHANVSMPLQVKECEDQTADLITHNLL